MGSTGLSIIFLVLFGAVYHGNSDQNIAGDTYEDCETEMTIDDSECLKPFHNHFRTFDGSCNNRYVRTWGAALTRLRRLLEPEYYDERKVDLPRGFLSNSNNGKRTPPANEVCRGLFQIERENKGNEHTLSTMYMTFGQFLDHDLTGTPHGKCDVKECTSDKSWKYPCYPILFEGNDGTCTSFPRSKAVCQDSKEYNQLKPRQQMNAVTAFIDASQVYGSSAKEARSLRTLDGSGEMKMTKKGLLPFDKSIKNCQTAGGCSLVGDFRADENIALGSMHTLWVREHNRIAKELKSINGHWNGNRIFQVTRKIVSAMWQRIVYKEYIPLIARLPKYKGYSPYVNPSIINSFAAAAFRYGHSLVPEFFAQLNKNYDEKFKPMSLRQVFFNRKPINKRGIEPTMFGLLANESNTVDTGFCHSISRKLFIKPGEKGTVDLAALNIQRGRDHGLPTYGKWREFCGLEEINDWDDLKKHMPNRAVNKFKNLYDHPNDIDIFAAGIAENHVTFPCRQKRRRSLVVGPTFECLFREQFKSLRDGDRFFYRHKGVFTKRQYREIKKVTLSSVLCANLKGITSIQPRAFYAGCADVDRVECDSIARINLEPWKSKNKNLEQQIVAEEENDVEEFELDEL